MQKTFYLDSIYFRVCKGENQVPEMQKQLSQTTDKLFSDQDFQEELAAYPSPSLLP